MSTNIGLLGGTFNPIHRGHIDLGLNILSAFNLDYIYYILSARPPHKKYGELASSQLRWEMLLRALKPFPALIPCDIEMQLPHDSWTIDTVQLLIQKNPYHRYFFISGSEGFLKIRTWKNYKQLLQMISFIVILRLDHHKSMVIQLLEEENIPYTTNSLGQESFSDSKVYLYSYHSGTIDISSTLIREHVRESKNIEHFVDSEVKKIMEENKLYEK